MEKKRQSRSRFQLCLFDSHDVHCITIWILCCVSITNLYDQNLLYERVNQRSRFDNRFALHVDPVNILPLPEPGHLLLSQMSDLHK